MYDIGDKIVYPMHGAGVIESIEEKEILGEKKSYYIMKMPVGEMKVMIPVSCAEMSVSVMLSTNPSPTGFSDLSRGLSSSSLPTGTSATVKT